MVYSMPFQFNFGSHQDGLAVSISVSHADGRVFMPQVRLTKNHHNKSAKWHCGRHTLEQT